MKFTLKELRELTPEKKFDLGEKIPYGKVFNKTGELLTEKDSKEWVLYTYNNDDYMTAEISSKFGWQFWEFNEQNKLIYSETSNGIWEKYGSDKYGLWTIIESSYMGDTNKVEIINEIDELIKDAQHIWDSRTHLDLVKNAKPEQKNAFQEELNITIKEMEEFREKYLTKILALSILNKRMRIYLQETKGEKNE